MRTPIGISAFGLLDSLSTHQELIKGSNSFSLSNIILPGEFGSNFRCGEEAEKARVHSGLYWPKEAELLQEVPLRRAPISLLWRALVESEDKQAYWKTAKGIDYPVAKLLAKYAFFLASQAIQPDHIQAALAIPDQLDETGQETLLRECRLSGLRDPFLVWRPIAASLLWIESHQQSLLSTIGFQDKRRHIHVLYFGPDGFEFTKLFLKRFSYQSKDFILPLRSRPEFEPLPCGFDWGASVIEKELLDSDDAGAFWQLFSGFPEVWKELAGQTGRLDRKVHPWSTKRGWRLWNSELLAEKFLTAPAHSSQFLRKILKPSFQLKEYGSQEAQLTFSQKIHKEIASILEKDFETCEGIILCGPLISRLTGKKERDRLFLEMGIPELWNRFRGKGGRFWLVPGNALISQGAGLYAYKRQQGIPAYLDTMPELSLLTETRNVKAWHPLLDASVILGGQEFKRKIPGQFILLENHQALQVVLCKGKVPQSAGSVPVGITEAQARIVRLWVRKNCDSLSTLRRLRNWGNVPPWALDYSWKFGKEIFELTDAEKELELETTPYRKNTLSFPSTSPSNTILDVEVSMKPAAGLAKVTFSSQGGEFLKGRKIHMNYDLMKPALLEKNQKKGWPELTEIAIHPEDEAWEFSQSAVQSFLTTSADSYDYIPELDRVSKATLRRKLKYFFGSDSFYLPSLTEAGRCATPEGEELLAKIVKKIEADFEYIRLFSNESDKKKFFSRVTWLYLSTPQNIIDFLRKELPKAEWDADLETSVLMESCGKCFSETKDIKAFFTNIARRLRWSEIKIYDQRAVKRILSFRENGTKALTPEFVLQIARRTVEDMKKQASIHNFKAKFYASALLLLYLLRVRIVSDEFAPDNEENMASFREALGLLNQSVRFYREGNIQAREKASEEFKAFIDFEATSELPSAVMNLAEDDD